MTHLIKSIWNDTHPLTAITIYFLLSMNAIGIPFIIYAMIFEGATIQIVLG